MHSEQDFMNATEGNLHKVESREDSRWIRPVRYISLLLLVNVSARMLKVPLNPQPKNMTKVGFKSFSSL